MDPGSHASILAVKEAGKFVFWLPLWGGRICKMRPFLSIGRVHKRPGRPENTMSYTLFRGQSSEHDELQSLLVEFSFWWVFNT